MTDELIRTAQAHGAKRAEEAFARENALAVRAANLGLLIAEGDSWFDYPFHDVLGKLKKKGFEIASTAHMGDTVEDMAHGQLQLQKLAGTFARVKQDETKPKAILLSGGGNDIAGAEFGVLLNHAQSSLPPLNESVVAGVVDVRIQFAMASLIQTVTTLSLNFFGTKAPILLHGYAHPVADGRGYGLGPITLSGPWLAPGFEAKGYPATDMALRGEVMRNLIDRINQILQGLTTKPGFEHVRYVDLRGVLSDQLIGERYKTSWANELHPTEKGFELVADEIAKYI